MVSVANLDIFPVSPTLIRRVCHSLPVLPTHLTDFLMCSKSLKHFSFRASLVIGQKLLSLTDTGTELWRGQCRFQPWWGVSMTTEISSPVGANGEGQAHGCPSSCATELSSSTVRLFLYRPLSLFFKYYFASIYPFASISANFCFFISFHPHTKRNQLTFGFFLCWTSDNIYENFGLWLCASQFLWSFNKSTHRPLHIKMQVHKSLGCQTLCRMLIPDPSSSWSCHL